MALLTGASLLVRTLDRLRHADLGFDPRGVAVFRCPPRWDACRACGRRLLRRGDPRGHGAAWRAKRGRRARDAARLRWVADDDRDRRLHAGARRRHGAELRPRLARVFPHVGSVRCARGGPSTNGTATVSPSESSSTRRWRGGSGPTAGRSAGSCASTPARPFNVEVIGVVPDVHYRMVREAADADVLRAAGAVADERRRAARPRRRRSVGANRRVAAGRRRRRSRRAGDARAHACRSSRAQHRRRADGDGDRVDAGAGGAAARDSWPLRDDGVPRRPADAGDRRAHGARREDHGGAVAGGAGRPGAGARRRRVRAGPVDMGWTRAAAPALRHRRARRSRASSARP